MRLREAVKPVRHAKGPFWRVCDLVAAGTRTVECSSCVGWYVSYDFELDWRGFIVECLKLS